MTVEKDKPRDDDYWNNWVAQEQPFEDSRRWIDPELVTRAKENWEQTTPEEKAKWEATFKRVKELSEKYPPSVMYATTPHYRDEFEHRQSYYDRILEHPLIITTPRGKSNLSDHFFFLSQKVRQRGNPEQAAFIYLMDPTCRIDEADFNVKDGIVKLTGDIVGDVEIEFTAPPVEKKKVKARKPLPYYHNSKKPWKNR